MSLLSMLFGVSDMKSKSNELPKTPEQLSIEQQQWLGGADPTDPYIAARMPQATQPAQSNAVDPSKVNYGLPKTSARSSSGIGLTAASAPALGSIGGGAVSGVGVQYGGGIPTLLRSYGEPSAGLLRYIEG